MTETFLFFVTVKRSRFGRDTDACRAVAGRRRVDLATETARDIQSGDSRLSGAVNLHPIASREHDRFSAAGRSQQTIRLRVTPEMLERFHVSSVMTESDAK